MNTVEQSSISLAKANARFFARKPFPTGPNEINQCPLCKGETFTDDFLGGGTHWRQCHTCSSGFKDNFPTEEEITKFYTEDYRDYEGAGHGDYPRPAHKRTHVIRGARQFALVTTVIKAHRVFLDIGCALGWSVHVADFLDLEAYGVEPARFDRQWAKEHLGLDLHASLEELPRRDFDLVNMSHMLEHVIDPVEYLTVLYNEYMAPGGRLIIEVPRAETPSAWSAFHAVVFNTESMQYTLQEAGFAVELVRSKDTDPQYPPNLIWCVGRKPHEGDADEYTEVRNPSITKHP